MKPTMTTLHALRVKLKDCLHALEEFEAGHTDNEETLNDAAGELQSVIDSLGGYDFDNDTEELE